MAVTPTGLILDRRRRHAAMRPQSQAKRAHYHNRGAHPQRTGDLPNLAGVVYHSQQPIVLLAAAKSTSHSSP